MSAPHRNQIRRVSVYGSHDGEVVALIMEGDGEAAMLEMQVSDALELGENLIKAAHATWANSGKPLDDIGL